MGEENGYKEVPAEKSSRSLTRQATGKSNGADYLPDFVDNRPSVIAQKKQIDSIYAQSFLPFSEERVDKEPMGLAAVRGNMLQQQAAGLLGRNRNTVAQRQPFKSFPQAAPLGLVDDTNAFFGANYTHYKRNLAGAPNRSDAFKNAATEGGNVGEVVGAVLHTQLKRGAFPLFLDKKRTLPFTVGWGEPPEEIWKQNGQAPGSMQVQLTPVEIARSKLDPFVITQQAAINGQSSIDITTMYDAGHYSYVVKVEEGNTKGVIKDFYQPKVHGAVGYVSYHTTHDETENNNILNGTLTSTESYTKLAGEGARFLCVRNHIAHITDNTIFYTDKNWGAPKQAWLYGISFHRLWKNWDAFFKQKFNVTDVEVQNVVLTQGETVDRKIEVNRDYDLRLGQAVQIGDKVVGLKVTGTPQTIP